MPLRHIPNSVSGILVRIIRAFTPYTKEQFVDIAVKVCPRLKEEISRIIGEQLWKQGSKDMRGVISLRKLIRKGDGLRRLRD